VGGVAREGSWRQLVSSGATRPFVGAAAAGEARAIAELLAAAFCDNPLNLAVVDSPDPLRRLRACQPGTRDLVDAAFLHDQLWVARDGASPRGALVGSPPGAHPLPPPPLARRLRGLWVQGWRVAGRWAEVFEVLQRHHPEGPHWYLATLGVEPPRQGRGVGTRLLRSWLEHVDARAGDVYLETDRELNVSWYQREGFGVLSSIQVLGVPVWCMRRPHRTGA